MYILTEHILSITPQESDNGNYTEINLTNGETIFVSKYINLELRYISLDLPIIERLKIDEIAIDNVEQVPTELQALIILKD